MTELMGSQWVKSIATLVYGKKNDSTFPYHLSL